MNIGDTCSVQTCT